MDMKRDLPTFMISFNPLKKRGFYLVHTKEPFFVADVIGFKSMDESLEYEAQMTTGGRTVYKGNYYVIDPAFIIRTKLEDEDLQRAADKEASLFRRAADWLHAYLKEMDK